MDEQTIEWKGYKIRRSGGLFTVTHHTRTLPDKFTTFNKALAAAKRHAYKEIDKAFKSATEGIKRSQLPIKDKMRKYKKLCKEHSMLLSNLSSED